MPIYPQTHFKLDGEESRALTHKEKESDNVGRQRSIGYVHVGRNGGDQVSQGDAIAESDVVHNPKDSERALEPNAGIDVRAEDDAAEGSKEDFLYVWRVLEM